MLILHSRDDIVSNHLRRVIVNIVKAVGRLTLIVLLSKSILIQLQCVRKKTEQTPRQTMEKIDFIRRSSNSEIMQTSSTTNILNAKEIDTLQVLKQALEIDLGFHSEVSSEMSHDFHAFPAKFPPQLPRLFIEYLTQPGEKVLDPMMGSGTTVLEAVSSGRVGIGFDIDPLATILSKVKVTHLDVEIVQTIGNNLIARAEEAILETNAIENALAQRFTPKTKEFVDYWFAHQTQIELLALIQEIEKITEPDIREFYELIFSAIIITKSGGVSLAWDLAHTRPHKLNQGISKTYKPAIKDFRRRLTKNLQGLQEVVSNTANGTALVSFGSAEHLPLANDSIDLIVTSPPYASNAIDYMRAHKFSLIWLGKEIDILSKLRSKYIGGENVTNFEFAHLPKETENIVKDIVELDAKKGATLHRYYSEMDRVLTQSFRVLKPSKAALIVVGSSTMRGKDTRTQDCIGEIAVSLGFDLIGIATRKLDRDRRMMPARRNKQNSQIEERMHEEYVIALQKPMKGGS